VPIAVIASCPSLDVLNERRLNVLVICVLDIAYTESRIDGGVALTTKR